MTWLLPGADAAGPGPPSVWALFPERRRRAFGGWRSSAAVGALAGPPVRPCGGRAAAGRCRARPNSSRATAGSTSAPGPATRGRRPALGRRSSPGRAARATSRRSPRAVTHSVAARTGRPGQRRRRSAAAGPVPGRDADLVDLALALDRLQSEPSASPSRNRREPHRERTERSRPLAPAARRGRQGRRRPGRRRHRAARRAAVPRARAARGRARRRQDAARAGARRRAATATPSGSSSRPT